MYYFKGIPQSYNDKWNYITFLNKEETVFSKAHKIPKLKIQKLDLNECHQLIFIKELEPFWKSSIVF